MSKTTSTTWPKVRASLLITLILAASAALAWWSADLLSDPTSIKAVRIESYTAPDGYNKMLNRWQKTLAPIAELVPMDESIGYLRQGRPGDKKAALHGRFAFIRAVLAPRRVSQSAQPRFVLVDATTDDWVQTQPQLRDARSLHRFGKGVALFEKVSP